MAEATSRILAKVDELKMRLAAMRPLPAPALKKIELQAFLSLMDNQSNN